MYLVPRKGSARTHIQVSSVSSAHILQIEGSDSRLEKLELTELFLPPWKLEQIRNSLVKVLVEGSRRSLLETSIHTKAAVSESESAPASEAEELVVGEGKRRSLAAAGGGGGMFCVALQNADPTALQAGLSWACGQGHADCTAIQPGGPCYKQNDLPALASYAYNDYFQRNANSGATCSFNGTATTTTADPTQCNSMAGSSTTPPGANAPAAVGPFTPGYNGSSTFGGSPNSVLNPLGGAGGVLSGARRALCLLLLASPLFFLFFL
ncbi:hypothetical protein ABZP36_000454 [Zizania latifolia]